MPSSTDPAVQGALSDNRRFARIYIQAVLRGRIQATDEGVLIALTLAEKALKDDTAGTPEKLFLWLLGHPESWDRNRTLECESRALARMNSSERYELAAEARREAARARARRAGAEEAEDAVFGQQGPELGFLHAVMAQCFLPQQALPAGITEHTTRHGRAFLTVAAGLAPAPSGPKRTQVPAGAHPRLILPYIIGQAVQRKTPVVDLGKSLRRFMRSIGLSYGGTSGRMIHRSVLNVAAAEFILGQYDADSPDEEGDFHTARVVKSMHFWRERESSQRAFWTPHLTLSDDFYRSIQERRVPVSMEHLAALSPGARRMDLYVWLAYRTRTIPTGRPVYVPLKHLWPIFAPGIAAGQIRKFRYKLRRDLKRIAAVYDGFNVSLAKNDCLRLARSRPPIHMRRAALPAPAPGEQAERPCP